MLTQVDATSNGTARYLPPWGKLWLAATTRPSLTTYQGQLQSENVGIRHAFLWILVSGVVGGVVNVLGSLLTPSPQNQYFDLGLLIAIPLLALLIAFQWAIFVTCTHLGARLFKGKGTYGRQAYVFAAFSAPLLITVSVLSVFPRLNALLLIVFIYWFGLYVLGLQAVQQISRLKAFLVVLMTFVILSCVFLGVLLLASYLGRYVL